MGKKFVVTGYAVEVEPTPSYARDPDQKLKEEQRHCQTIVQDIKRHVDGVESAVVHTLGETVCEHCGYAWQPDSAGVNACCEKDLAEHPEDTEKEGVKT